MRGRDLFPDVLYLMFFIILLLLGIASLNR
jgi:hypothetical protein